MQASVAIVLILCGTILIAIPYIHNAVVMDQMTSAMTSLNKTVNLRADMPKHSDSACVIGGIVMIAVGGIGALRGGKTPVKSEDNGI